MSMLSERMLQEMAEYGISEEDVTSAVPLSVKDYSEIGDYSTLEDLKESFEGKPENAHVFANSEGGITLSWDRSEHPWEIANRLIAEAKRARYQEQRDKEEYERLRGKYEEK